MGEISKLDEMQLISWSGIIINEISYTVPIDGEAKVTAIMSIIGK